MGNQSSKNSFLIQGSILAFAGILVRVIGLIYRIPLNRILGDVGLGYYGPAFDFYNIFIVIAEHAVGIIKNHFRKTAEEAVSECT